MSSSAPDLSVVIPSYQSEPFLRSTLEACATSVARTSWRVEVIVVDDGSTDGTADLVESLATSFPVPLRLLRQANQGRFLARWAGLQEAHGHLVLLLDSRVLLEPTALATVQGAMESDPTITVWNGHAVTDPSAPLVGHFWEVPVYLFWGRWLARPRSTDFGLKDFNRFPKGTTFFLAPRKTLVDACLEAWPQVDAALTSDDTKIIRGIAAHTPIHLDPNFRAIYRPRTSVRAFIRHSLGRGTFLVDSFGGTSLGWTTALVAFGAGPLLLLIALGLLAGSASWVAAWWLVGLVVALAMAPALLAATRGCPRRGLAAYVTYLPVFALPYWLGVLRGLYVHRRGLIVARRTGSR